MVIGFIGLFNVARNCTLQFTVTNTLMSRVTSSLSLLGSGIQWRTFPFLWIPELSPILATNFLEQQLTKSKHQKFSN
jgi:hypothetical protein